MGTARLLAGQGSPEGRPEFRWGETAKSKM